MECFGAGAGNNDYAATELQQNAAIRARNALMAVG
jgi:hypothetical protein